MDAFNVFMKQTWTPFALMAIIVVIVIIVRIVILRRKK